MARIALLGATGRMGRRIAALVAEGAVHRLTGALAVAGDPALGEDAGQVAGVAALGTRVTSDLAEALRDAEVAIDFTLPGPSLVHARACRDRGIALVVGTTGHDAAQRAGLEAAATAIPLVIAPNMSLGVNVLLRLAELAARALDASYDAEVFEAHHRHKVDAPSGTALALGRAVAAGRGVALADVELPPRSGATGPRPVGGIGFSVMRGGDIVGEHRLVFAGPGEQLELGHVALDRGAFGRGALRAAGWVVGRSPGVYTMADVLGL